MLSYMKFGPVGQEMLFKTFLIWSFGDPPVRWSENIYAILKEVTMRNIHVKLYEIWTSGSGGDIALDKKKGLQTHDGQRPTTIAHLELLAQVS